MLICNLNVQLAFRRMSLELVDRQSKETACISDIAVRLVSVVWRFWLSLANYGRRWRVLLVCALSPHALSPHALSLVVTTPFV